MIPESAQKQYDATDPENRLVADELERRWDLALQRVRELEMRIEQQSSPQNQQAIAQPEQFESLAADLEALWQHPEADAILKKRIVRTLIQEIVVDVDPAASEVVLVISATKIAGPFTAAAQFWHPWARLQPQNSAKALQAGADRSHRTQVTRQKYGLFFLARPLAATEMFFVKCKEVAPKDSILRLNWCDAENYAIFRKWPFGE